MLKICFFNYDILRINSQKIGMLKQKYFTNREHFEGVFIAINNCEENNNENLFFSYKICLQWST